MDDERVKEIKEKLATAAPGQYGYRSVRADVEFLLAKLDQAGKLADWIEENEAKCPCPDCEPAKEALLAFRTPTPPEAKP